MRDRIRPLGREEGSEGRGEGEGEGREEREGVYEYNREEQPGTVQYYREPNMVISVRIYQTEVLCENFSYGIIRYIIKVFNTHEIGFGRIEKSDSN